MGRARRRAVGTVGRPQRPSQRPSSLRRGAFASGGARSNVVPARTVHASMAWAAPGRLLDSIECSRRRGATSDRRTRTSAALEPERTACCAERCTPTAEAHMGGARRGARLHCEQADRPANSDLRRHGAGHAGHAVARAACGRVHPPGPMVSADAGVTLAEQTQDASPVGQTGSSPGGRPTSKAFSVNETSV